MAENVQKRILTGCEREIVIAKFVAMGKNFAQAGNENGDGELLVLAGIMMTIAASIEKDQIFVLAVELQKFIKAQQEMIEQQRIFFREMAERN